MSLISLFGPTRVRHGDAVLQGTGFGGCRPRQVLEILALEPGRPRSRDELAEAIWEGEPPFSYVATLHGYICVLRRGLASIGASGTLVTLPSGYMLDPEQVTVDLHRGYAALDCVDAGVVLEAVEVSARGLLVDDQYASWAVAARESWDRALGQSATEAARDAERRGEHLTAVRLARAALAAAPYSEGALRELMRALSSVGQVAEALNCYHQARHRLAADLGVGPQRETEELYLGLLRSSSATASVQVTELVRLLHDALSSGPSPAPVQERAEWSDVGQLLLDRCS